MDDAGGQPRVIVDLSNVCRDASLGPAHHKAAWDRFGRVISAGWPAGSRSATRWTAWRSSSLRTSAGWPAWPTASSVPSASFGPGRATRSAMRWTSSCRACGPRERTSTGFAGARSAGGVGTFLRRESAHFKVSCDACESSWGLAACGSCRARVPYLNTAGDAPQQPDRYAPGLLDRDYGRDVLAVPCLRGSGDAYVCPACRTCPGGQDPCGPNCAQATGPV